MLGAAQRAGPTLEYVQLLPASKTTAGKTVDSARTRHVIAPGCTDLGEIRVQETLHQCLELAVVPGLRWHELAIEEGPTVARVGQANFGARALPDSC